MNPTPAVLLLSIAVSLAAALVVIGVVLLVARVVVPLAEGCCARHEHPPEANRRARDLLLSKLDAKQRRDWFLRGRFDVVGASGRRYTLARYRPFNVRTTDAVFCVQVHGNVPAYDKLLAQKLLIESDEQRFLAHANVRTFSRAWEPRLAAARARYPQA